MPPPAATKPITPIAFARSAGSVKSVMISESATAATIAPPRPCTARAATSISCEVASPQASEATREEADAEQEQAPVAEEVAEPAAEEHEAAEGQHVGVDHPGERRLREAEVLADRRQRDVHDRRVEHDHQVAQAEDEECEPVLAGVGDGHRFLLTVAFYQVRPGAAAELIGRPADEFRQRRGESLSDDGLRDLGPDRPGRPARALRPRLRAARARAAPASPSAT